MKTLFIYILLVLFVAVTTSRAGPKLVAISTNGPALAGTRLLTMQGDVASNLVSTADVFLLKKLDQAKGKRARHWNRDLSSGMKYAESLQTNRTRLAHILGVRDAREDNPSIRLRETIGESALLAETADYKIFEIEWKAFGQVNGRGLIAVPNGKSIAQVIAIPDASQSPEQLFGLEDGIPAESQYARKFADAGALVVVPTIIDRNMQKHGGAVLSNREYVYRPAFELGRHILGYELQKILVLVDWMEGQQAQRGQIMTFGWGEGGGLSLFAGALDERIGVVGVSGFFEDRTDLWQQPIDRNVFGLLEQFGDAELAAMVFPRKWVIEDHPGPILKLPGQGGAPAELKGISPEEVKSEFQRAVELGKPFQSGKLVTLQAGSGFGSDETLKELLGKPGLPSGGGAKPKLKRGLPDKQQRMEEQIAELQRHSQALLIESPYVRAEFMKKLDTSSLANYEASTKSYREFFYDEVIGRFADPLVSFNAQSRLAYETPTWKGYEVVLDVFDGLFAYGILLVPKDIKPNERRPVVVCQHGLEGRPQDIIADDHDAYHDFAAKLAERGFITFSPQNLYIFTDRFRTLQRKANPLKKTLFSLITPQHQQIVNWLKTVPQVDPDRIGFYGLSYGGKTAMRVPALVEDYKFSICSADFNEWVWKNASTRSPYSYVRTGEYEIFEWDLGSTFNYAEMAALIAPRPFMVERGHFDGVAPDEMVAHEYAKVRHLYAARLKIGERTEIEWFVGPHTINGVGTYHFIHKHLNWPEPGK